MTSAVEVRGADELKQFVGQLPATLFAGAKKAYRDAVFTAQKDVLRRLQGNPLHTRTGALARSILPEVSGTDLKTLSGRIYSTSRYAPIQEYGGVVRAKDKYRGVPGGPYLNIPTRENKTAAGVMRMGAREVFSQGGYVAGRVVYLNGVPMFVLVKEVKIPPRLGMIDTAQSQVPTLIEALRNMNLEQFTPDGF